MFPKGRLWSQLTGLEDAKHQATSDDASVVGGESFADSDHSEPCHDQADEEAKQVCYQHVKHFNTSQAAHRGPIFLFKI